MQLFGARKNRRTFAPLLLSSIIMLIGLSVLLGWHLHNEILQKGVSWFYATSYVEGLGIFLMGLGIFLFILRRRLVALFTLFIFPLLGLSILLWPSFVLIGETVFPQTKIAEFSLSTISLHLLTFCCLCMVSVLVCCRKRGVVGILGYVFILGAIFYDLMLQGLSVFTQIGSLPPLVIVSLCCALWAMLYIPDMQLTAILRIGKEYLVSMLANVPILSKFRITFGLLIIFMLLFSYVSYSFIVKLQNETIFTQVLIREAISSVYDVRLHEVELLSALEEGRNADVHRMEWERAQGRYQIAAGKLVDKLRQAGRGTTQRMLEEANLIVSTDTVEFTSLLLDAQKRHGIEEAFYVEKLDQMHKFDKVLETLATIESDEVSFTLTLMTYTGHSIIVHALTFMFLALLFAFGLSRLIARPLVRLRHAVDKVKKGEEGISEAGYAPDEIGHLASAFSKMTAWLMGAEQKITNAYQRLRAASQQNEIILGNIGEAVVALDSDMRMIYCNAIAKKLLEYTDVTVEGELLPSLYDDRGIVVQGNLHPLLASKQTKRVFATTSYKFILPSGKFLPVSLSAAPIMTKDQLKGWILVFRDFTREKEIDRAKSEFVSLASHQLRTPLTAMKWYIELLMDKNDTRTPEDQRMFLQEAYDNSIRMTDLVNALLDVSRVDLGTFSAEHQDVHIRDIIATVIEDLQKGIKEKKLQLVLKIKKSLPTLFVDPKMLQIIFQNLLSNATKYTPEEGKVSIEVSLVPSGAIFSGMLVEKESIGVVIKDTGYGIPQEQQEKVFMKFFRADNVRKLDTDGNGLGLYIVQTVVTQLKGKIWLKSRVGKGTSFMLLLPVEKV